MINVGIVGATGYTGRELIKILSRHSEVEITSLTAKIEKSVNICEIFPVLKGEIDLICEPFNINNSSLNDCDVVFLAVPHGVSIELVKVFLDRGNKVIDLSADYRLDNVEDYKIWYGIEHTQSTILEKAVYGLPEFNKESIKEADLIANPGCFPTGILLSILPLLREYDLNPQHPVIIDSKTGTSGAGRRGSVALSFAEVDENVKAYKLNKHPHSIEILQQVKKVKNRDIALCFVPHLISIKRGILNTIYVILDTGIDLTEVNKYYEDFYKNSRFVYIVNSPEDVSVSDVVGTNKCHIGITSAEGSSCLIIVSVIDNLLKGAAGQAVQNMNIMYGFDESAGLI